MEKYINTSKNTSDVMRRFFKSGVSLSLSASSAAAISIELWCSLAELFGDAPYPASSTALIIASGDAEHIENEDENYWDVTIKGTFAVYDEYGRYSDSEAFTAEVEVDGITGDVLGIIDYSID